MLPLTRLFFLFAAFIAPSADASLTLCSQAQRSGIQVILLARRGCAWCWRI